VLPTASIRSPIVLVCVGFSALMSSANNFRTLARSFWLLRVAFRLHRPNSERVMRGWELSLTDCFAWSFTRKRAIGPKRGANQFFYSPLICFGFLLVLFATKYGFSPPQFCAAVTRHLLLPRRRCASRLSQMVSEVALQRPSYSPLVQPIARPCSPQNRLRSVVF
jgi:hypothetical protein